MALINSEDKKLLKQKDINEETVLSHLDIFRNGIPFLNIKAPATFPDGICVFDMETQNALSDLYDEAVKKVPVLKFVPASGAASRMFKDMFTLRDSHDPKHTDSLKSKAIDTFFEQLPHYAFYKDLCAVMLKNGLKPDDVMAQKDVVSVCDYILTEKGLNYASTPKALIPFHNYGTSIRTALEEHLVEAALYCRNTNGEVALHFTISPEHEKNFKALLERVTPDYEELFDVTFQISYSFQKPSTDTIAVDMNNNLFRDSDGSIVFRPGGHGALIENLNDCVSQLIFIKNIDNIVPDRFKALTVRYKKVIGGLLVSLKDKIRYYLHILDNEKVSRKQLEEIADFAQNELFILFNDKAMTDKSLHSYLFKKLNRPLRVCGMVKNEGEPGGGPFWVQHPQTKEVSLQIVESSQIDTNKPAQRKHIKAATHFNPVDLVCWVSDYKGRKFDLHKYVDPDTGFISIKSKDGRELKALELPGLWNGAMADWITVFVDVPLITFNPVKTTADLLRKEHCAREI